MIRCTLFICAFIRGKIFLVQKRWAWTHVFSVLFQWHENQTGTCKTIPFIWWKHPIAYSQKFPDKCNYWSRSRKYFLLLCYWERRNKTSSFQKRKKGKFWTGLPFQLVIIRPCLVPTRKRKKTVNAKFCEGILLIWSTKWSLFTNFFVQMGYKSRDESNDAN